MCDQTCVLRFLADCTEPASASAILVEVCKTGTRKHLLKLLGSLMQKKLVVRANKRTGFCDRSEPLYVATPSGAVFARGGKTITSGPNRPLAGVRRVQGDTFRRRLWNAFRISRKATLPQLIEIARLKSDGEDVSSNALRYMTLLVRARVAARLPMREKGHALTSPGHVRFALIRDLGPLAPIASVKRACLVNLNATTDAEKFIPYGANT